MPTRRSFRPAAAQVETLETRRLLSGSARSFDGTGNNLADPMLGSVGQPLIRLSDVRYDDSQSQPATTGLPSARAVSNAVFSQTESTPNRRGLTDFVWMWGQFVDHDITLSGESHDAFNIPVPTGDPHFDPFGTGEVEIPLTRSYREADGEGVAQQTNTISAYLDGSVVYGSDAGRAAALRTFEGGRLKMTADGLMPHNTEGYTNAGGDDNASLYLAGDIRANENVGLISLHTLFVREHNRLVDLIARNRPQWDDEARYQWARDYVTAQIQSITYNEFLPALIGSDGLDRYDGYDPTTDPTIVNEFSTAAYRMGHSLISNQVERLDADFNEAPEGHLDLASAFFRPDEVQQHGIDTVLRGASVGLAEEFDTQVIDDLRNFLFGPPGAGGLDLASLNIQRGRDHGLGSYNDVRRALGMRPAENFGDVTTDAGVQAELASVYADVESLDLWVGLLAEDHVPNASVGETMRAVVCDQFERLRDGDRFFYEGVYRGRTLEQLASTTLADVIRRNTGVKQLQPNVFFESGTMTARMPEDTGLQRLRLTLTDRHAILRDMRSGELLSVRDLSETRSIVIESRSDVANHLTVDLRRASQSMAGLICFTGGTSGHDRLQILGGGGSDTVSLEGNTVQFNGHRFEWAGLDSIDLRSLTAADSLTVGPDVGVTVLRRSSVG